MRSQAATWTAQGKRTETVDGHELSREGQLFRVYLKDHGT